MILLLLRRCAKCGVNKPLASFGVRGKFIRSYCRKCDYSNSRLALSKRERADPRAAYVLRIWQGVNQLARKRGEPCDIDKAWVEAKVQAGTCEVTGLPFSFELSKKCNLFAPSVDRIDPTQPGHMKENCRIVLWCINAMKHCSKPEEFDLALKMVANAVAHKG